MKGSGIKILSTVGALLAGSLTGSSANARVLLDRLEVSVNAASVLTSDVRKFRQTYHIRTQLDPLFADTEVSKKGSAATDKDITNYLVDERLITQQFEVPDPEVEQNINSILTNNKIDRNTLRGILKDEGVTYEEYFELMRASIAKRDLIDRDIRSRVFYSDDDLKNEFYSHYSKGGGVPRAYQVKMLTVSFSTYKTQAAAKDAILNALKQIKAGETFEEVTKRVSDDANASNGGDLGILTEDKMSPTVKKELKNLKIGGISDVITNPGVGYFILKLANIESGESRAFDSRKEEIRSKLSAAEYQRQIDLWLDRERQKAFIHRAGEASFPAKQAQL